MSNNRKLSALPNYFTIDGSGNITFTGTVTSSSNKILATQDYVTSQLSAYALGSRTLTINGTSFDLTADRSWTISGSLSFSGDVTGSGTTGSSVTLTLANSGVTIGTYRSVTVDVKGRVTAGTNPTTISGYGITDFWSQTLGAAYTLGANSSISGTDNLEQMLEKLQGQMNARVPTSRTITINGTALDLSADRSWTIAAGVTSFNTRTGAITLSSSDVTTALGYSPYNSSNPSGYITSSSNISGTSAGVSVTLSGTNASNLLYAQIADNDFARIRVGGDASNAGWMEIATADDGTEPIYVRQYTGVFGSVTRTATLLDGSGNTNFPGTMYAYGFRGNSNVAGTGEASFHPAGMYSTGTQWLYGTTYRNGQTTSGQGWMYLDWNYGHSVVGVYTSVRYQGVWSMGDAYKLAADGTNTGNLYGLAWSHPNAGGQAGFLTNHGLIHMMYGTAFATISDNIWCRNNITAYSDIRVKENIEVISNAMDKINAIRGVTFTRNDVPDTSKRHAGVIAQEVEKVLPEVITTNQSNGHLSVAYGNMVGLTIEGLKEHDVRINEQQKTIDLLLNEIKYLKQVINAFTK